MKTKSIAVAVLLLGILACGSCSGPSEPISNIRELTPLERELLLTSDAFGLQLFREVVRQSPDPNVFISPLSISMALGMTANGAAGATLEAMRQTLAQGGLAEEDANAAYRSLIEYLPEADPKVQFAIANSIWYRQGWTFKETFYQQARDYFRATVQGLDFSDPGAAGVMNDWVSDNTDGKIKDIIAPPIDPFTVMFLINAIYFKGDWTYEFDPADTEDDLFNLAGGGQIAIEMMHQESDLLYHANEMLQIADLPYGDGAFSMTLILPWPQVPLDSVMVQLTADNWAAWTSALDTAGLNLALPRFKFEYKLGMMPTLQALGMGIAFTPGAADFSRMIDPPTQLFISEVLHKTFVQVDEKGTEAAAVTLVGFRVTSGTGGSFVSMRLDRPFIFAIRERSSGAILFIGTIGEPAWEN